MKNEIANVRPEIKRDAYASSRSYFPAGTPGRVASTMSQSTYDVPPATALPTHFANRPTPTPRISATAEPTNRQRTGADGNEPLEIQQLRDVEVGKLEKGGNDGKRK